MKRRLRIRPLAEAELEELAAWIARDDPQMAEKLVARAVETAEGLLRHPEAFAMYPHPVARSVGLRRRSIRGFPNHLLFYAVTEDAVEIRRVLHAARDLPAALRSLPIE